MEVQYNGCWLISKQEVYKWRSDDGLRPPVKTDTAGSKLKVKLIVLGWGGHSMAAPFNFETYVCAVSVNR